MKRLIFCIGILVALGMGAPFASATEPGLPSFVVQQAKISLEILTKAPIQSCGQNISGVVLANSTRNGINQVMNTAGRIFTVPAEAVGFSANACRLADHTEMDRALAALHRQIVRLTRSCDARNAAFADWTALVFLTDNFTQLGRLADSNDITQDIAPGESPEIPNPQQLFSNFTDALPSAVGEPVLIPRTFRQSRVFAALATVPPEQWEHFYWPIAHKNVAFCASGSAKEESQWRTQKAWQDLIQGLVSMGGTIDRLKALFSDEGFAQDMENASSRADAAADSWFARNIKSPLENTGFLSFAASESEAKDIEQNRIPLKDQLSFQKVCAAGSTASDCREQWQKQAQAIEDERKSAAIFSSMQLSVEIMQGTGSVMADELAAAFPNRKAATENLAQLTKNVYKATAKSDLCTPN